MLPNVVPAMLFGREDALEAKSPEPFSRIPGEEWGLIPGGIVPAQLRDPGRPRVDPLKDSGHVNMKELQCSTADGEW